MILRHRPGHDRHDLPRLRPRGASWSAAPTASSTQHFPRPGWVEHDAAEIWDVTQAVAGEALDGRRACAPGELEAVGITNQRETVVRAGTRRPASRCTARSSGRTAAPPARCDELRERGPRGARPRAHRPGARPVLLGDEDRVAAARTSTGCAERARDGPRGVRDDRLVADLQAHRRARDRRRPTPRARCCYDIARGALGRRSCCELLGVPERALPEVRAELRRARRARAPTRCHGHDGAGRRRRRRPAGGAVRPGAASSPGSARTPTAPARSCCSTPATAPPAPPTGLLATVAWQIGRSTTYALEAAIFVTGAAVQWLRDGLGIIERGGRDRGAGGVAGRPTTASTSCRR